MFEKNIQKNQENQVVRRGTVTASSGSTNKLPGLPSKD